MPFLLGTPEDYLKLFFTGNSGHRERLSCLAVKCCCYSSSVLHSEAAQNWEKVAFSDGPAVKLSLSYTSPREVLACGFLTGPGLIGENLKRSTEAWSYAGWQIRMFGLDNPSRSIATWDGQTVVLCTSLNFSWPECCAAEGGVGWWRSLFSQRNVAPSHACIFGNSFYSTALISNT